MSKNLFIDQLIKKERHAIEVFVKDNEKAVYRTCLAYTQNENDALDLVQDVFIKALDKLHQYKGDSSLNTWLIKIAINLSLNFIRDNKKRRFHLDISDIQITDNKHNHLKKEETKLIVRKAIYKLPEKQRKVFILNYHLNLSYKEISEITGYTISSIESLLFRARKKLRELLIDIYKDF